jgi:hypothetical protein
MEKNDVMKAPEASQREAVSDSDEESDFMFPTSLNLTNIIEMNDNESTPHQLHSLFPLMTCLLTRDLLTLETLKQQQQAPINNPTPCDLEKNAALHVTELLLQGKYLEIVLHNPFLSYQTLLHTCSSSEKPFEDICRLVSHTIQSASSSPSSSGAALSAEFASYHCLLIGYAYYELFCQCNYTGPELSSQELSSVSVEDEMMNSVSKNILSTLECDGIYPFRLSQFPHTLFISRAILRYLADPSRASWQQGIQLDSLGNISSKLSSQELDLKTVRGTKFLGILKSWLSMRVCVCHARLLQSQSHTKLPTLWKECQDLMNQIDQSIERFQQDALTSLQSAGVVEGESLTKKVDEKHNSKFLPSSEIHSLYLLEKGLCCHHFDYQDKVLSPPPFLLFS